MLFFCAGVEIKCIAVGKKAGQALTNLGVRFYFVRHMKDGGKEEFS
jgi:hypothetical protein